MKIVLNPKYESLRDYLLHIEEHFDNEGVEMHSGRNVIRSLEAGGYTLCVKRYAPAPLRRRVLQMIYKKSKGKLAYLSPLLLRERGFESPESVAFIVCRHGLLSRTVYFVSLYSNYRYDMQKLLAEDEPTRREVLQAFARYAAHLHEGGFLHRDFSSTNILYDKINDRYHFSLVDTNSMKCGSPVKIEDGCRSLAQLDGDDAFFAFLAECYARERGADPQRCAKLIDDARRNPKKIKK